MKIAHSVAFFRSDASGYESPRAGTSQGIFFKTFMPILVRAHYAAFKGWDLAIHHDDRVREFEYFPTLERMHRAGLLTLVPMGECHALCSSMLWRLQPIFAGTHDWVVCRDIDSLPMFRDRSMVEEAIASGAAVHAILDSESHSGPLMGGMTAFNAATFRGTFPNETLESFINKPLEIDLNQHGADQRFLNTVVWPRMKYKTFIHQRRNDVQYPEAMRTEGVHYSSLDLDNVVRHIGAAYDKEKAAKVIAENHKYELVSGAHPIDMLEKVCFPGDRKEPWYAEGASDWLDKRITGEWDILEYGGGASSVWYRNRTSKVITAEDDPLYRVIIEEKSPGITLVNLDYQPTRAFDLIAIDGKDRVETISRVKDFVKPDGLLLLDNSEESRLGPAHSMLSDWIKTEFKTGDWTTTIWRRP